MNYKILSVSAAGETLNTEVEFSFKDGSSTTIIVPHFRPEDKAAIIAGIEARASSEESAKNAVKNNLDIVAKVSTLIGVSVKV